MSALTRRRSRVVNLLAAPLLAGALLTGFLLVAPAALALFMAYPPSPLTYRWQQPEPPYQEVSFPSDVDGAILSGWYLPGAEAERRAVIIVHGFLNDRRVHGRGLPLAEALRKRGFSVLLFDLRGQGKSDGGPVTFGAREQWDVAGAVRYLRGRGVRHVGILGFSTGAIAAIMAAEADPGVEAVVADSALTDLHGYLERQVVTRTHLGTGYADYAVGWYRRFTRSDERAVRPAAAMAHLGDRPVLLIHGMADRVIPFAESRELLAAAGGNPGVELWLVPAGRHTHSYEAGPEAYIARVVGFLDENVPAVWPGH